MNDESFDALPRLNAPTRDELARAEAEAVEILSRIVAGIGGQVRDVQVTLTKGVARSIITEGQILADGPTGVGKSFALISGVLAAKLHASRAGKRLRVVFATATKHLQDQYLGDLAAAVEFSGVPFAWSVLKGATNYACLQAVDETKRELSQGGFGFEAGGELATVNVPAFDAVLDWLGTTETGDLTEVPVELDGPTKRAVRVGQGECIGRKCKHYDNCWSVKARRKAMEADIIIVNTALLIANAQMDGVLLPNHQVVVIDEAHDAPDIAADGFGASLSPGSFRAAAQRFSGFISREDDQAKRADALEVVADQLEQQLVCRLAMAANKAPNGSRGTLEELVGTNGAATKLRGGAAAAEELAQILSDGIGVLTSCIATLDTIQPDNHDLVAKRDRLSKALYGLAATISDVWEAKDGEVCWVEAEGSTVRIRKATANVAPKMRDKVWSYNEPDPDADPDDELADEVRRQRAVVLASATIHQSLGKRAGLDNAEHIKVPSPFDYSRTRLLIPDWLPEPKQGNEKAFREGHYEVCRRVVAATDGGVLLVYTSHADLRAAYEVLGPEFERMGRLVLCQHGENRKVISERFTEDGFAVLFGTRSFAQGFNVPGTALRAVIANKCPFPAFGDPLVQARKELAGRGAFDEVDVPFAATLLAQTLGRLVRRVGDDGLAVITDSRLSASGKPYARKVLAMAPPMPRIDTLEEAEAFLRSLPPRNGAAPAPAPAQAPKPRPTDQARATLAASLADDDPFAERPARREISWREVPDGCYALEDSQGVVKVKVKVWNDRKVALRLNDDGTDTWLDNQQQMKLLRLIAEDPMAAACRYGKTTTRCGICGRTLDNPDSVERGIGPVCAEKLAAA